jgi:thiol-disulfide isomerase/thioredoxin
VDPALARRAINQIAADDPAWGLGGFLVLPYRTALAAGDLDTYRSFFYDVLRSHPSSELKAGLMLQMLSDAKEEGADDRQRLLYAWMAGEYADTRYAEIARARFNPDKRVQAGKPVPRFEVGALRGDQTFVPVDFEGRHVLIDFWATWCQPCIEEFPNLRTAYQRYDRDELTILSVSLDEERKTVTTFLQDRDLPWQHAFAEEAFDSPIAEQFQVTGIPKPVLVGPDGTIVAALDRLRGEALMETLRKEVGAASEQ